LRSANITFGFVFGLVPGGNAEEAGFRIDRAQVTVGADLHPGDVITHGPDAVAHGFERRYHHR
jgi:hypothetical protein